MGFLLRGVRNSKPLDMRMTRGLFGSQLDNLMAKRRRETEATSDVTTATYRTVFIDTSLDTHLAMIVSDSDTVSDLKSNLSFLFFFFSFISLIPLSNNFINLCYLKPISVLLPLQILLQLHLHWLLFLLIRMTKFY